MKEAACLLQKVALTHSWSVQNRPTVKGNRKPDIMNLWDVKVSEITFPPQHQVRSVISSLTNCMAAFPGHIRCSKVNLSVISNPMC